MEWQILDIDCNFLRSPTNTQLTHLAAIGKFLLHAVAMGVMVIIMKEALAGDAFN